MNFPGTQQDAKEFKFFGTFSIIEKGHNRLVSEAIAKLTKGCYFELMFFYGSFLIWQFQVCSRVISQ